MTPDEALETAVRVVRQDLDRTARLSPVTDALVEQAAEHRRWWVGEWAAGADCVPGLLAQDVQDAVHETIDADWPLCPEHQDHALFVEPDLGPDPFWVCHRTGLPVAAVGSL